MLRFNFPIVIIDEDYRSENTSGIGIRALAEAIEKGGPAATSGQFLGHITLEELRPRLEAAR